MPRCCYLKQRRQLWGERGQEGAWMAHSHSQGTVLATLSAELTEALVDGQTWA